MHDTFKKVKASYMAPIALSKPKHLRCKDGVANTKNSLAEICRQPRPFVWSFDRDDLTAIATIHCYFCCSRPPDVDGINIFGEDDQVKKFKILFCGLVIISIKILIPSKSGALGIQNSCCDAVIMTKILKPGPRRPWLSIWISHLFRQALLKCLIIPFNTWGALV